MVQTTTGKSFPEDFDAVHSELGTEKMEIFHESFTKYAHTSENEHEYWLSLNTLYSGIEGTVKALSADHCCYILSTKRSSFIAEILESKSICWPESRIIDSGNRRKVDIITELLDSLGAEKAVFVEDQVDYFKGAAERVSCYLASWVT